MKILTKKTLGLIIACAMMIGITFNVVFAGGAYSHGENIMVNKFQKVGENQNRLKKAFQKSKNVCKSLYRKPNKRKCIQGAKNKRNELANSTSSNDYDDGKIKGISTINKKFQNIGEDCDLLDDVLQATKNYCNIYPNNSYKNGCVAGAIEQHQEIQWTDCKVDPDVCTFIGKEAAETVSERICNLPRGGASKTSYDNYEACKDVAITTCKAKLLKKTNEIVSSGTCEDDSSDPITLLFTIYDTEIQDGKDECENAVNSMLGTY